MQGWLWGCGEGRSTSRVPILRGEELLEEQAALGGEALEATTAMVGKQRDAEGGRDRREEQTRG